MLQSPFTADKGKAIIVDGLSWRFALLGVLNAVYTYVWGRERQSSIPSIYSPQNGVTEKVNLPSQTTS